MNKKYSYLDLENAGDGFGDDAGGLHGLSVIARRTGFQVVKNHPVGSQELGSVHKIDLDLAGNNLM